MHAEFPEYVTQVLLDGAFGNAEGICNLAVAHSLHQQIDDLPLAHGERRRLRLAHCRRGPLPPLALPSLRFAAIRCAPISAFTALFERPLQLGLRRAVRS